MDYDFGMTLHVFPSMNLFIKLVQTQQHDYHYSRNTTLFIFKSTRAYFPKSGCHFRLIPVPSKEEYNPNEVFSILMR
jgi:hypothetical protein